MRVQYKPQAIDDIKELHDYISSVLKNPAAAKKLTTAILHSVSQLKTNPLLGAELRGKFDIDTDIRFIIVSKQLIFYRVQNDIITIIRVIDGRRDYMVLLWP